MSGRAPGGTVYTTAVFRAAEERYGSVPWAVVAQEKRGHRGGTDPTGGAGVWVAGWLFVPAEAVAMTARAIVRERVRAGHMPRVALDWPTEVLFRKRLRKEPVQ